MASTPIQTSSSQYQGLYRATVEEAAAGGGELMGKMVAVATKALYARELTARTMHERDALIMAGKLLQGKDAEMRAMYPKALLAAFLNPEQTHHKKAEPLALEKIQFDQLELMDEGQVQESVAIARAQQVALLAADASLAELNTLICAAMGLKTVRPESNPLRPEVYVKALKQVVEQVSVPSDTRLEWLASMSVTLGSELHLLYRTLAAKLQGQGVVAVGYARVQAPLGFGVGLPGSVSLQQMPNVPSNPSAAAPLRGAVRQAPPQAPQVGSLAPERNRELDESLLTLDSLRRLLSGELDQPGGGNRMAAFAQQFAREFEGSGSPQSAPAPVTDFASTVPAAFEALEEMKQVGNVVQRLQQRSENGADTVSGDSTVAGIRDMLRRTATGVGQALSLEVVTLMVDNMVRNPRLLEPIQRLIAELEPSLLLLSLVDPRFFTDKQHPARELLQEVTHRSMAFESTQSPGFGGFLKDLQEAVQPLTSAAIENAEPFERVLEGLRTAWELTAKEKDRARAEAVQALQHAEQRNLLAEKIAREIDSHPDSARVPEVVLDFLCGPWAQVVAQARISGGSGSKAADKFQALISAMLWSVHPDLNRKNIAKLTKLVPLLLVTVRDGLDTIHYSTTKTTVFLEALMGFHQMAFRAAAKPLEKAPEPTSAPRKLGPRLHVVEDGDPWVAPEEAQASNFIAFEETKAKPAPETAPETGHEAAPSPESAAVQPEAEVDVNIVLDELPLGSWIELFSNEQWVRTQLTWASPHGTLFLFTSAFGTSQSMTRRSRDKLLAAGHLRLVSGQPVVDGALDAVAQIAMRNSVDTTY
jgi:hypothetical protein